MRKLLFCISLLLSFSGSLIEAGGSWVSFDFDEPVLITSGKTVILISRVDKDNDRTENMLRISNNYDEDD